MGVCTDYVVIYAVAVRARTCGFRGSGDWITEIVDLHRPEKGAPRPDSSSWLRKSTCLRPRTLPSALSSIARHSRVLGPISHPDRTRHHRRIDIPVGPGCILRFLYISKTLASFSITWLSIHAPNQATTPLPTYSLSPSPRRPGLAPRLGVARAGPERRSCHFDP